MNFTWVNNDSHEKNNITYICEPDWRFLRYHGRESTLSKFPICPSEIFPLSVRVTLPKKRMHELNARSGGLTTKLHRDESVFHLGIQQTDIAISGGAVSVLAQPNGGGRPGGGNAPSVNMMTHSGGTIKIQFYLLGTDLVLSNDFRLIRDCQAACDELGDPQRHPRRLCFVAEKIGLWTPYVAAGHLHTDQAARLSGIDYDDQSSLSIGASYTLTPDSKLKGEWMRVHVGVNSILFDRTMSGATISHQDVDFFRCPITSHSEHEYRNIIWATFPYSVRSATIWCADAKSGGCRGCDHRQPEPPKA